jgi:membrane-associated phospholipid phosphatase
MNGAAATPLPDLREDRWQAPVPRLRYFGILAAQYLVWLACYLGVNAVTEGRSALQPLLPYEDRIPLLTVAYPVYAAVYFQILLPLFLARTRRAFARVQLACALASLMAFAVFLIAPMPYPRPPLLPDGPLGALLSLEYTVDRPRCTFPSLHVAFAWLFYLGLRDEAPRWRTPLLLMAIGVSVSTVLVKQHFIVDLPGGMLLALAAWWLAGRAVARVG